MEIDDASILSTWLLGLQVPAGSVFKSALVGNTPTSHPLEVGSGTFWTCWRPSSAVLFEHKASLG